MFVPNWAQVTAVIFCVFWLIFFLTGFLSKYFSQDAAAIDHLVSNSSFIRLGETRYAITVQCAGTPVTYDLGTKVLLSREQTPSLEAYSHQSWWRDVPHAEIVSIFSGAFSAYKLSDYLKSVGKSNVRVQKQYLAVPLAVISGYFAGSWVAEDKFPVCSRIAAGLEDSADKIARYYAIKSAFRLVTGYVSGWTKAHSLNACNAGHRSLFLGIRNQSQNSSLDQICEKILIPEFDGTLFNEVLFEVHRSLLKSDLPTQLTASELKIFTEDFQSLVNDEVFAIDVSSLYPEPEFFLEGEDMAFISMGIFVIVAAFLIVVRFQERAMRRTE